MTPRLPAHSRPPAPQPTGFTLIELLVVLSISVVLLMVVSTFFLTFVVSNTKVVFEQKLKRDGEQATTTINQLLRVSHELTSPCATGMTSLSFLGTDDLETTLTGQNGRVASLSAITSPSTTFYLTSDFSQLDPANTITFNCYTTNEQVYIETVFSLRRGTSASNDQTTLIRQFQTGVNLRN